RLITSESGKPYVEALLTEVLVVLDTAQFLIANASRLLRDERIGHANLVMKAKRGWLRHEPYGVVGIISPWNYPFAIPATEALAALVAGNAVIIKPSEFTTLSALELQTLLRAAGLKEDLLQVLPGAGASGAALVNSQIDKLIFTGSVASGKRVAQAAAARLLPVVLELGGKDAMLVLDDADVAVASSAAVWGAFVNAGQTCLSVERCYVHRNLYEPFLAALVEKTGKLRVGNGLEPRAEVGPLIHRQQLQIVERQVEEARQCGARVLAGGMRLAQLGPNYYAPTVLADVNHEMRIMREETFGPVLPVMAFDNDGDAVRLANDSEFGLAASIWTRDRSRGDSLAARLEAGTVMVNDVVSCFGISEAPHGGFKFSGLGRTHGRFGLQEMVRVKYVDSDLLPRVRKVWWYGYGPEFSRQMEGFVDFLFSRRWRARLAGGMTALKAYIRPGRL
ncbi:MAG TPA: aldehyde dehydrogenase family protein, partial [Terriglobales bacterium]|nr:aldehyde dehydrogenase family protein [Terriglobales bacterium]